MGFPLMSIDGATRLVSRSKSSSWAVLPMIFAAASGSLTPGSWIVIWLLPCVRISGSDDAEAVDAVAHDRDRAVEVFLRQLPALGRNGFLRDLEATLEVEPERRLLVDRRRRDDHQRHGDERGDDQGNDDDGSATGHGCGGRLAALWRRRWLCGSWIYSFPFVRNLLYAGGELRVVVDELRLAVDDIVVAASSSSPSSLVLRPRRPPRA